LAKILRKAVVLRKVGEHDILVPLIYNEDVAGWLHNIPTKGAERCDLTPIPKDLVTEGSTLVAGVAEDSRTLNGLIFDKLVISFHDFQLLEDAKLHRSAGLLPTKATMAPYSQYWLAGDLSLESTAHARPVSFSHLQIIFLQTAFCVFREFMKSLWAEDREYLREEGTENRSCFVDGRTSEPS
jgi:hypothetical protein